MTIKYFVFLIGFLLINAIPASGQTDVVNSPRTGQSGTGGNGRDGKTNNGRNTGGKPKPKPSKPAEVLSRDTVTANGVSFIMVRIQGGTFTMGATKNLASEAWDDENPAHQVTLSDYSIGETEVTQALWQAVMGNNPSFFTGDTNRPVEKVSWNNCQEFIKKLNQLTGRNFRLPTEAEWEYAARGGRSNGTKYAGSNDIGSVAWYTVNASDKGESSPDNGTSAVKTKSPNELGLYDMSGNVWEWCQDWKGNYNSSAETNPQGPSSGSRRVSRGGSWSNSARNCRVSNRGSYTPDSRGFNLGLRLGL